jgi:hypothetical protein
MGKLKEHYHEEISSGMTAGAPELEYAQKCMRDVSHAVKLYRNGDVDVEVLIIKVFQSVNDFDNMDTPCQPK